MNRSALVLEDWQKRKSEMLNTATNTVDVDYFKVMHIPLLGGGISPTEIGMAPSQWSSSTKIWPGAIGLAGMQSESASGLWGIQSRAR
jgi:hypothetical protein